MNDIELMCALGGAMMGIGISLWATNIEYYMIPTIIALIIPPIFIITRILKAIKKKEVNE